MTWLERLRDLRLEGNGLPRHRQNRQNPGFVSFGSAVEAQMPSGEAVYTDPEAESEAFEERVAIMEFDGGMTRAEAERLAASVYFPPCEPPRMPLSEWDGDTLDMGDLRPCSWCRNLARTGQCIAALRGELRAARDYCPTFPDQPRRCIGYLPGSRDPDLGTGRERWPELVEWQAPNTPGRRP